MVFRGIQRPSRLPYHLGRPCTGLLQLLRPSVSGGDKRVSYTFAVSRQDLAANHPTRAITFTTPEPLHVGLGIESVVSSLRQFRAALTVVIRRLRVCCRSEDVGILLRQCVYLPSYIHNAPVNSPQGLHGCPSQSSTILSTSGVHVRSRALAI